MLGALTKITGKASVLNNINHLNSNRSARKIIPILSLQAFIQHINFRLTQKVCFLKGLSSEKLHLSLYRELESHQNHTCELSWSIRPYIYIYMYRCDARLSGLTNLKICR